MNLSPGTRLGSYEITGVLGAGGMGEVYRARDTKLNRDVAIKILPQLFALDPDRLARFEREAQTLAALNHSNIAQIYGVIETPAALVMELVDGDDLSVTIARGPVPVAEALAIARQIAEALEVAHEQGIVHRDLKPANVKMRPDGTVKVLDFGLAKATDPSGPLGADVALSPTLTAHATAMGVILGTAAYMSPEQARGKLVDKRTDVWAFGCVLYEMLTGRKTFDGEDATEIISSVVKSDPDWTALPPGLPVNVRAVVTGCVVKDRKARIPDFSVVRYLLDGTIPAAAATAPPLASRKTSRFWPAAVALLAMTTVAAGVAWYRAEALPPGATFHILPPDSTVFTAGGRANATVPVVSPDGRTVAFTAQDSTGKRLLWLRPLNALDARSIAGTDGASYPFWSPDSRSLGYAITGKLMRVAATGGPSTVLCTLNPGIISRGGSWSPDGTIIFNNGPTPLYRVSSSGGNPTVMGALAEGENGRQFPAFLPDGRHFLFHSAIFPYAGVYAASLDGGEPVRVVDSTTGAVYDARSGRILFVRKGTLLTQPFDPKTLKVSGEPVPIAEHLQSAAVPGLVAFSVSSDGVLVYGTGESVGGHRLQWIDRSGKVLGPTGPEAQYRGLSLSPDGTQVAAHRHDGAGGDVWLTDVKRDTTSRLTFDESQHNASPIWSPDGSRVAFSSVRDGKPGIWVKRSDNTGGEELWYEGTVSATALPMSWTADGRAILFRLQTRGMSTDLWTMQTSGTHAAAPLLNSSFAESHGQASPDGRWIAYSSNETGRDEIYVQPMSASGGKWAVSNVGGTAPRWRGDSRELYYVGGGRMWAVDVTARGAVFVPGTPRPLFEYNPEANAFGHQGMFAYASSSDGLRFLISRLAAGGSAERPAPIVVVLNWLEGIAK